MTKRLLSALAILLFAGLASLPNAAAQDKLTDARQEAVRDAVQKTHDSFERQRRRNGFGNLVGGTLTAGLGGYFVYAGLEVYDDPFVTSIGVGVLLRSVATLVEGVFNIASSTSQERIAKKLLDDPEKLRHSGLLFLEQESLRMRRARLLGGTTQIFTGLASIISLLPLAQVVQQNNLPPELLTLTYGLFGLFAVIETVGGVIKLVGKSSAEKIYRNTLDAIGGRGPTPSDGDGPRKISRLRLVPALLPVRSETLDGSTEDRVAPGVAFGFTF